MSVQRYLNIGIDFGGVLSIHDSDHTHDKQHRNLAINMEGALESLQELKRLGHKLYLISFCGKSRAIETANSIKSTVPEIFDGLFFVKNKDYKKHICQHLNCDVMIDDTLPILVDIAKHTKNIQLVCYTGDPSYNDPANTRINNITLIDSWKDIVEFCSKQSPIQQLESTVDISKFIYLV
jgi:FMN phosphatase YigB (HAD superfamily)